jgi:cytochrome c-type biogenesis protein CcmH
MTLRTRTIFCNTLAGLDPAIHELSPAIRRPPGQARGRRVYLWLGLCLNFIVVAMTMIFLALPAHAVRPDERLADPGLEARARDISKELRCLVCRNQSIDDSEADLAHDLRVLVRQRLSAGDSDHQVVDYIVSRYGDFVLLRPPFEASTWLLWGGPLLVLVIGGIGVRRFVRRQAAATVPPLLSTDEERRLAAMLDEKAGP